ncbi:hypothetical protein DL766_010606 [Monosporascus sp. MC13-8B]|uniref:BZIP domain-containing protein n=1 Tax=Monosporascus cannonballus TaxID=155416 RepID=A0ABY0H2T9_9PEZI|nr:hypothetical protein DL762_006147 [Monosporascus cannonballus]RYP01965.1 hypothetical protein DL766_010606 [Monosporascus sp. MC13-8B]
MRLIKFPGMSHTEKPQATAALPDAKQSHFIWHPPFSPSSSLSPLYPYPQASGRGRSTISEWPQQLSPPPCASGPPSPPAHPASSSLHPNRADVASPAIWGACSAPGPADLLSTPNGSIGPLTGGWLLYGAGDVGNDVSGGGIIGGADWPFPGSVGPHGLFPFGDTLNDICHENVNITPPSYNLDPSPLELAPPEPDMPYEPLDRTLFAPLSSLSREPPPPEQPRGKKRSLSPVDPITAIKRQRNNEAARKYRQKRIDRITELESELAEVRQERDDLRIRLARQEAETAALRSMLQLKPGSAGTGAKG